MGQRLSAAEKASNQLPSSDEGLIILELQKIARDHYDPRWRKAQAWLDRILGYGAGSGGVVPAMNVRHTPNGIRQGATDLMYHGYTASVL